MLLDHSLEEQDVKQIEKILKQEKSLESYHYLKTRKSGDDTFIEAHIVFRDKSISLAEAHSISESLESSICETFAWALITLHLDIDPEPEVYTVKKMEN